MNTEKLQAEINKIQAIFDQSKNVINTEEATKNALVMPMLQALGYNVFNPTEVIPEFTADIGLKKGEKVDYALLNDGVPEIIVECKHWRENLDLHTAQLYRYFGVSKVRFGVLTNGLEYRFFSDLENKNIMDRAPFLIFTINATNIVSLEQLSAFHKESFNNDKMLTYALDLKNKTFIKKAVEQELSNPSNEFIRLLIKKGFGEDKVVRSNTIQDFKPLIQEVIEAHFIEEVKNRLDTVIKTSSPTSNDNTPQVEKEVKKTSLYDENHCIKNSNSDIIATYNYLKTRLLSGQKYKIKFNKYYISFLLKTNIVDIEMQTSSFNLYLNADKGKLNDTKRLTVDMHGKGHMGNGDYKIRIIETTDIDDVMELVEQTLDLHLQAAKA